MICYKTDDIVRNYYLARGSHPLGERLKWLLTRDVLDWTSMSLSLLYFLVMQRQIIQWSFSKLWPDVVDSDPLGLVIRLQFELPKSVLKVTKAGADSTKIQFAISSRSGACQLNMSPSSGFDYPHIRIEPRESASSGGSCKRKQLQMCTICKRVVWPRKKLALGLNVPLWHRIVWRTRQLVGSFEVVTLWWTVFCTIVQFR